METNILKYKDYQAVVNYSTADKVLYGKIFGINDLVTFEGESGEKLEKAFHEAVEDYVETCKELGKEPEKSYSGSFNVRIKPAYHKQLALNALKKGITLNKLVKKVIEEAVTNTNDDVLEAG